MPSLLCKSALINPITDPITDPIKDIRDKGLSVTLESVGIAKDDFGERSTTTRIVNYFLDDTANVSVTFGKIEGSELGGTFSCTEAMLENPTAPLIQYRTEYWM
jgi:hypothetical protein